MSSKNYCIDQNCFVFLSRVKTTVYNEKFEFLIGT